MNDAYFQQIMYKKPCMPEDGKRLKSKVDIYICTKRICKLESIDNWRDGVYRFQYSKHFE